MKGAVTYSRVSTVEQTQNLSLPTQVKTTREYCRREGLGILREFVEEGESAKTTRRPQLMAMLEFCRKHKGKVQCVVIYSVSRLARNSHDHHVLRAHLGRLGVTLRSVTEPLDDSPSGKLMEGIVASFAEFDNNVKSERTRVGMTAALERGRWTYRAPIGYLNGVRGGPSLLPDPARFEPLRRAFEAYASGEKTKPEILRGLAAQGFRTLRGQPLIPQRFHELLKSPVYAGRIEVPSMGASTVGDFEAMVSEATFRHIQNRLRNRGREVATRNRNHPDFPLRRFVRCAGCDTPLTGSWSKGRGRRYAYYHCRACAVVRVSKEVLHEAYEALLERLKPRSEYIRLFNEIVRDVWREEQATARKARERLENRIRVLRERSDTLDEAYLFAKEVDRTTYERQRDKIRDEIVLAELELSDATIEELDLDALLGFAEHLVTNAARMWQEASLEHKQKLQAALFPEGLAFDSESFRTAVTCLAFQQIPTLVGRESGMASPTGFEPVLPP